MSSTIQTVWIVTTHWHYDESVINGVFDEEGKARELKDKLTENHGEFPGCTVSFEEWEVG